MDLVQRAMSPIATAVVVGVSLLTATLLTPLARAVALRIKAVTRPSPDRWRTAPTPLLGGVALVLATAAGLALAGWLFADAWTWRGWDGRLGPAFGVVVSATAMFLVGLADDLAGMRPQIKFLLQLLAGVALVSCGAVMPVTPSYVVNVLATLFWFVALTNAFNLLDGLDGVAAGVAAIASFFLGLTFAQQGAWWHASVAWSLTGATLGFLRYNFHPASIFMGDAGSLFLGSVLAGLVASLPTAASTSLVSVLFVPLAIVAVPLLDTTLVTVTRFLAGRPISEGGLDHSTYRLIALGLTESQVAVLLYGFAAVGGAVAIRLTHMDRGLAYVLGTTFLVAMSLLAAYLARIQFRVTDQARRLKPMTVLARNLIYRKRLAEILLDVVLITLAYYGAYRLKFDGALPPAYAAAFEATVGVVIAVNVVAFGLFGVYRGAWEYVGIFDVYRVVSAILLSGAVVFGYGIWRVPELQQTHSIVYVDTVLAMAFVLASRLSFKSLELVRERFQKKGARVLIYGADDAGELTLRELRNHGELGLRPVCFVDDDTRRHGAEIHGVPIVAGFDSLAWVVNRYRVDKIVIGTRRLGPEAVALIQTIAEHLRVEVAEVKFDVRWLGLGSAIVDPGVAAAATALAGGNGGGNGNGNGNGTGKPTEEGRSVPGVPAPAGHVTITDLRAAG